MKNTKFSFGRIVLLMVVLLVGGGCDRAATPAPTSTLTPIAATAALSQNLPAKITVDTAYAKYQSGTFFLDVRTRQEWDEAHIPNATLIPLDELPQRLSEIPVDQEIVVVCRSGNRSKTGRDVLLQAGFNHVTSMQGGLMAWQAQGYPVE